MKKVSTLLVTALIPLFAATMAQSCAGGESAGPADGSGGDTGSGGDQSGSGGSGSGSGGRVSSGGSNGTSSGGSSSGGSTGSSSGGKVGSGGSTGSSSGGKVGSGGSTGSSSGGTTGSSSGGTTGSSGGTTGGTASGGTTGGGSCTATDATMMVSNGLATSGTWTGYAYTYMGSAPATITPTCGTTGTCFSASMKQLCVSGSVGPDTTYNASAGFGWNIGGTTMTGTTATAIVPGGTGLAYDVMGLAPPARFQVTDGAGKQYCADVPTANKGTVPWASFAQMCYATPKGTAYSATTAISKIEIVVPSNSGTATPFCFCVLSLGPA